jgi:hypothetical protein
MNEKIAAAVVEATGFAVVRGRHPNIRIRTTAISTANMNRILRSFRLAVARQDEAGRIIRFHTEGLK